MFYFATSTQFSQNSLLLQVVVAEHLVLSLKSTQSLKIRHVNRRYNHLADIPIPSRSTG